MIYVQLEDSVAKAQQASDLDKTDEFEAFESVMNAKASPEQSVVSDLDGTLLRSKSTFPYFMIMAIEAGSPLRALILLLVAPVAWFLNYFVSEALEVRLFAFVAFAGLKISTIESVARGVLPKFFLEDLHSYSYKIFKTCNSRHVITSLPKIMVQAFLKDYLCVRHVLATEMHVTASGICSGLVQGPVLLGKNKAQALKHALGDRLPDIGLGDQKEDHDFMLLCKKGYVVPSTKVEPVPKDEYLRPLIFHDGRLVRRPTFLCSIFLLLWIPIALPLAIFRMVIGVTLPKRLVLPVEALLGVSVTIRGNPPPKVTDGKRGVLLVLSHKTLLDPVFISFAMGQNITAVTYSLSRVSELMSPIKTVRLTRCKAQDAKKMESLLKEGNLAVCPEGTTCREPFLLRFSALFAELTDQIVPVSVSPKSSIFHGTTARGWKAFDAFFFFMNPWASYQVNFLDQLPREETCLGGKSSHEVANHVQKLLADSLGFKCTNLTRKDKYCILAGTDGRVGDSSKPVSTRPLSRIKLSYIIQAIQCLGGY